MSLKINTCIEIQVFIERLETVNDSLPIHQIVKLLNFVWLRFWLEPKLGRISSCFFAAASVLFTMFDAKSAKKDFGCCRIFDNLPRTFSGTWLKFRTQFREYWLFLCTIWAVNNRHYPIWSSKICGLAILFLKDHNDYLGFLAFAKCGKIQPVENT